MNLPQHIIDLVGSLYEKGLDDESICSAAIEAWKTFRGSIQDAAVVFDKDRL